VLVPGGGYEAKRLVAYTLPPHAFEGPGRWFVIELHFEIAFRRVPAPAVHAVAGATTEVAVDANGSTCASILFTHVLRGRSLVVRRSGFGLIGGRQELSTSRLVQRVRFRNFFTYRGVRGGRNELTFRVGSAIGGLVRYVRILPDSGVRIERAGPLAYRVELRDSSATIRRGASMRVTASIVNATGLQPDRATFTLRYPARGLSLAGAAVRSVAWGPTAPVVTFDVKGKRVGNWPVLVQVEAAGSNQAAASVVRVRPAAGTSAWLVAVLAAAGALLLGVAALLVLRRRA